MTEEIKNMMFEFLKNEFTPTRRRNNLKRWKRVVVVGQGYLRNTTKHYSWKKGLDLHLVSMDLLDVLERVFATPRDVNTEVVSKFFREYQI